MAIAEGIQALRGINIKLPLPSLMTRRDSLPPMNTISRLVTDYREESARRTEDQVRRDREYQPSAPYYATFLYAWYRNPLTNPADLINPRSRAIDWSFWKDDGRRPPRNFNSAYLPDIAPDHAFDPKVDLYDSQNKKVIEWQLSLLRKAKMDVAFVSWWGRGDKTDKVFRHLVKDEMNRIDTPNPKLRFGIIYEPDLNGTASSRRIEKDLQYLLDEYGNEPALLKINGEPVIFAYGLSRLGPDKVRKFSRISKKLGIHYIAHVYEGYQQHESEADDWMQYAPVLRSDTQDGHSFSVSPGFKKRRGGQFLERNPEEFKAAIQRMVQSDAKWKVVTTFNELGEGTGIEPALSVAIDPHGKAIPNPDLQNIGSEIDILESEIPNRT